MENQKDDVANNGGSDSVNRVSKVKQHWQQYEDYGLARQMQDNEFSLHFDRNRSERHLMHGDICLSREAQTSEDDYAAAYYAQLRRDQTKDDERLAEELQRRFNDEEQTIRSREEQGDHELALRLQNLEVSNDGAVERRASPVRFPEHQAGSAMAASGSSAIPKLPSGDRLVLPPGVTPELLIAFDDERHDESIPLQPGLTPDQCLALQEASVEEDRRLAEQLQDYELAEYLDERMPPPPYFADSSVPPYWNQSLMPSRAQEIGPRNDVYAVISRPREDVHFGFPPQERQMDNYGPYERYRYD